MEIVNTLSLFFIAATLLWFYMKKKLNFWKDRGVETPPYSYIFGHVKTAFLQQESVTDRFLNCYRYHKARGVKCGGSYLFWSPIFWPIDLDLVKSIMQVDFQHFVDRGIYVNEESDPLSTNLFNLEGKKWKLLRKKLTPTFTSGKMKVMYDTLLDCTKGLYKVMDKGVGNAVDIKDIAARFTIDVIGSCAFGLNCNSLENPKCEFREKGEATFLRKFPENFKLMLFFMIPKVMKLFKATIIRRDINDFFMTIVKQNVEYREKNNIYRKDFMHLLIQLKNRGKLVDDEQISTENISEAENTITKEEIAAQAFVFFAAGFETSSTTMTFCLYELAKNKEIQDKLRNEIKATLAKHGNKLTYEAVMEIEYLERTIKETLRKYPPLSGVHRVCTKEYKIPGTDLVIEKGQRVIIPVIGIQRDPEYYPDPEKFDPDRFTEENKRTRPAFSFIPFGEGPRICIGMRFGMMQTKVGLTALLLHYEFSVNSKTKEPLELDPDIFMMSTKGGVWLDYKKISSDPKQC